VVRDHVDGLWVCRRVAEALGDRRRATTAGGDDEHDGEVVVEKEEEKEEVDGEEKESGNFSALERDHRGKERRTEEANHVTPQ